MIKEIVICIISLTAGYFISRLQEYRSKKYMRIEERFQKLYAPFEKMIWFHTHGAFLFSDFDMSMQKQFFDLLFNNYEYADSELKELLLRFKWVYDTPSSKDVDESNKCFFLIAQHISSVFNIFCKKLFLDPYSLKYADKVSKEWDRLP